MTAKRIAQVPEILRELGADVSTFGKRLRAARWLLAQSLNRPITQVDLGEQVGVSGVTISRWESDERDPELATLAKMAGLLGVRPGWLAFGDSSNE